MPETFGQSDTKACAEEAGGEGDNRKVNSKTVCYRYAQVNLHVYTHVTDNLLQTLYYGEKISSQHDLDFIFIKSSRNKS